MEREEREGRREKERGERYIGQFSGKTDTNAAAKKAQILRIPAR